MAQASKNANTNAQGWIDYSQRQVAIARAERDAVEAGRLSQIRALRDALTAVAPDHPLLAETGLVHRSGQPEVRWHREFGPAYDTVAIANSIAVSAKADAPWEQARLAVLAEPVECRRILLMGTWWFRGEKHKSEAEALRAREKAAESAAILSKCNALTRLDTIFRKFPSSLADTTPSVERRF